MFKAWQKKYPLPFQFTLAVVLFGLALFISTLIDGPAFKKYFPFVPVILLVLASWWLYKREGKSLNEIGLNLKLSNVSFLFLGLALSALTFLVANLVRSAYTGETLELSSTIDYNSIITTLYYILPTVAVEELLFRGYLFKKTISVSNVVVANIIFAILFTLIHIVDDTVLSRPGMLVMLIISIPVGHLLFATAMLRSGTLYFPIGLHLGNNWASRHLISDQADGHSIFAVLDRVDFDTWPYFIGFLLLYNGIFLLLALAIWKWPLFRVKKP